MIREYPVEKPTSALATGSLLYQHLLNNATIPAVACHNIWYAGQLEAYNDPNNVFKGDIPVGQTIALVSLMGKPLDGLEEILKQNAVDNGDGTFDYTFTGSEKEDYVLAGDLSDSACTELNIPTDTKAGKKIYNSNFKENYDDLFELTKISNELTAVSFAKAVSSWYGSQGKINYSEKDVLDFIDAALERLDSPEMTHILNTNHMAWSALDYVKSGRNVAGDLKSEFYAQQTTDFYEKDLATILPAMFYAGALLGSDPVELHKKVDYPVWDADKAAVSMQQYMHQSLQ